MQTATPSVRSPGLCNKRMAHPAVLRPRLAQRADLRASHARAAQSGRTATTTAALPLMRCAALRVRHHQPPRRDSAGDGQVPPLTASHQRPDDTDRTAEYQANDEQHGAPGHHDSLAASWVRPCNALVAALVVAGKARHSLLRLRAPRYRYPRQKVHGITPAQCGCDPPVMEDLRLSVPATSIAEEEVRGIAGRVGVHDGAAGLSRQRRGLPQSFSRGEWVRRHCGWRGEAWQGADSRATHPRR